MSSLRRNLRGRDFDCGVSVRRDPRDHALLFLAGARRRFGFPRRGSRVLLTDPVAQPAQHHRANYWRALAAALGWEIPGRAAPGPIAVDASRRIVIHAGAGHPSRHWPRERFAELAQRLRTAGWDPLVIDDESDDLDGLLGTLATAARFIGNDSGPGHLAALLNIPTFTIFGPSLPELFSPAHAGAAWLEGADCRYRPCWDDCRFAEPRCIQAISVDEVWTRVQAWLRPH
jgi:ADP-heptose:LPS heptosyltransferase